MTHRHTAAAALMGTSSGRRVLVAAGGVGCTGSAPLLLDTEALPYAFALSIAPSRDLLPGGAPRLAPKLF